MKVIDDFGWKAFFFGRHGILLTSIMFLLLLQPLVVTRFGGYLVEGLFVLVLLTSLKAIGVNKMLVSFELVLLMFGLSCTYGGAIYGNASIFTLGLACNALFLFSVSITILRHVFHSERITVDNLAGAVSVYLLLAIIWSYFYVILELLSPESFSFTQGDKRMELLLSREFHPFLYFSLVTITTVGYGDMSPVTAFARSLSTMEALVGQIYLTVLVAGLVGMYLSGREESPDQK